MITTLLLMAASLQTPPAEMVRSTGAQPGAARSTAPGKPATVAVPRRLVGHWVIDFLPLAKQCREVNEMSKWSMHIGSDHLDSYEETAWPTKVQEIKPGEYLIDFYAIDADQPFTYRESLKLSKGDRVLITDQLAPDKDFKARRFRRCPG